MNNSNIHNKEVHLEDLEPSFSTVFPKTHYYEIDSEIAKNRYSVYVTLPAVYDQKVEESFPVIYQIDANLYFPSTAPFHQATHGDVMSTLKPFILVSIGYPQENSHEWDWLRVRDLVPPGEIVPKIFFETLEGSVQAGFVSQEKSDEYKDLLENTAADKYLAFIESELHPALEKAFRINRNNVGIWGFSYGGLFTSYVALNHSKLFQNIGVSSPGIIDNDSYIFKLYDEATKSAINFTGTHLHITLGGRELSECGPYSWLTARGTSELFARLSLSPLSGLKVSSELIPLETHLTGGVPAWFSFLRYCYSNA